MAVALSCVVFKFSWRFDVRMRVKETDALQTVFGGFNRNTTTIIWVYRLLPRFMNYACGVNYKVLPGVDRG